MGARRTLAGATNPDGNVVVRLVAIVPTLPSEVAGRERFTAYPAATSVVDWPDPPAASVALGLGLGVGLGTANEGGVDPDPPQAATTAPNMTKTAALTIAANARTSGILPWTDEEAFGLPPGALLVRAPDRYRRLMSVVNGTCVRPQCDPPVTSINAPVVQRERSDKRNATVSAISAAAPVRPSGVASNIAL